MNTIPTSETLRAAREAKGLTRNQLAEISGIKTETIYSLEHNRRQGNITTWRKLYDALTTSNINS